MTKNVRTEIQRPKVARAVGAGRVAEFMRVDPATPIEVADGLDLTDLTDGILDIASDASKTASFPGERPKAAGLPGAIGFGRGVAFTAAGTPSVSGVPPGDAASGASP